MFRLWSEIFGSNSEIDLKKVLGIDFPREFSYEQIKCCFATLDLVFCQKKTKKIAHAPKMITRIKLLEKNTFLKVFLCARGLQLWQPRKKLVESNPFFAQSLKKVETMCKVWNNVFPQNHPRLRRLQFWQPRPFFPLKMKKKEFAEELFFGNRGFSICERVFPNFILWQFFAALATLKKILRQCLKTSFLIWKT